MCFFSTQAFLHIISFLLNIIFCSMTPCILLTLKSISPALLNFSKIFFLPYSCGFLKSPASGFRILIQCLTRCAIVISIIFMSILPKSASQIWDNHRSNPTWEQFGALVSNDELKLSRLSLLPHAELSALFMKIVLTKPPNNNKNQALF